MGEVIQHTEHGDTGVFFLEKGSARIAEMTYQRLGESRILVDHTFVDPALRGQGVARKLLDAVVAWARRNNTKVSASCSYVVAQLAHDKSLADVKG